MSRIYSEGLRRHIVRQGPNEAAASSALWQAHYELNLATENLVDGPVSPYRSLAGRISSFFLGHNPAKPNQGFKTEHVPVTRGSKQVWIPRWMDIRADGGLQSAFNYAAATNQMRGVTADMRSNRFLNIRYLSPKLSESFRGAGGLRIHYLAGQAHVYKSSAELNGYGSGKAIFYGPNVNLGASNISLQFAPGTSLNNPRLAGNIKIRGAVTPEAHGVIGSYRMDGVHVGLMLNQAARHATNEAFAQHGAAPSLAVLRDRIAHSPIYLGSSHGTAQGLAKTAAALAPEAYNYGEQRRRRRDWGQEEAHPI